MISFSNLLTKIKVVLAIGKVVFTDGKTAKILDDADKGADIAAAVKELVKPSKDDGSAN